MGEFPYLGLSLRYFEPRSGEGRISGRDEGVSDANDGSRRRNASGAVFPLKGGCREATEGWEVGLQKEHRVRRALKKVLLTKDSQINTNEGCSRFFDILHLFSILGPWILVQEDIFGHFMPLFSVFS